MKDEGGTPKDAHSSVSSFRFQPSTFLFRPNKEPSMKLYAHPFSSYCQKVLIALYENGIGFEFRLLAPGDEQAAVEFAALWPLKRMPVLVDDGRTVVEATIIIEYLDLHHAG